MQLDLIGILIGIIIEIMMIGVSAIASDETPLNYPLSCVRQFARPLRELSFDELSSVRADFIHSNHYSIEIPTPPIRNQCDYGSCWIHRGVAEIEQDMLTKGEEPIDISEQFLILHSLRERSLEALKRPGEIVKPGGTLNKADALIQRHGLIPASVWKPRVAFESSPLSNRLLDFLNARVAKYHWEVAETSDLERKRELLEVAQRDVLIMIESFSGPLPERFIFEGKEMTPIEWKNKQIGDQSRSWRKIAPPQKKLPNELKKLVQKSTLTTSKDATDDLLPKTTLTEIKGFDQIEKIIIDNLRKGRSIPISLEMAHSFIDKDEGIMSIDAFHVPEGFRPPPRAYRKAFDVRSRLLGTDHAMNIVGVDLDRSGKMIKFKVRNSHGEERGDRGFYHIYRDYFQEYLNFIAVRN